MPTFKFEAMDTAGAEVKDSVEALNEEEAQQKIRQMGYFVTKITETSAGKKDKKKKAGRKGKKRKVFTIGGVNQKSLVTFTRQFSTLQDAGLPVLRSLKILEGQMKPGRSRTRCSTSSTTSSRARRSPRPCPSIPRRSTGSTSTWSVPV